jgi:peptidoglycan/xylan/chitin deacetylase (PgdA/CDA1 family)
MHHLAKSALCALAKYCGILHVHERLARQQFLSVLLFHRVTDEIPEDGLTVNTRYFVQICRMLRRQFHVVPLAEIFRLHRSGRPFPPRTVAITFDDCYRSNLAAAQILTEHGLPACFFIPTAFIGTEHVFDWDRGLPRLANLSWDEVRAMADMGHEIGSHTCTHPDMAQVPLEEARRELVESKKILETQLARPVRWFAYPYGGRGNFSLDRLPLVTEAGYEGCVSGFGGFLHPSADEVMVPRESATYFRSVLHLELHLRGCLLWYHAVKKHFSLFLSGERRTAELWEPRYPRELMPPTSSGGLDHLPN